MARGWHFTKLLLSSAVLLSFSGMCILLLFLSFCRFFLGGGGLSLELCRVSSDIYLSSGPRTGLQPRILLGMVEARSVNVKKTTTVQYKAALASVQIGSEKTERFVDLSMCYKYPFSVCHCHSVPEHEYS